MAPEQMRRDVFGASALGRLASGVARSVADGGDTSLDNLTLLCTHHHTLLHEGGFTIHRDSGGGIYFRRPDGRVIPRSGYRADDMLDDVAVALPGENPSAEVRMAAIVHAYELDDECSVEPGALANGAWSPFLTQEPARTVLVQNPSAEGFARAEASGPATTEVREQRSVYRSRTIAA